MGLVYSTQFEVRDSVYLEVIKLFNRNSRSK